MKTILRWLLAVCLVQSTQAQGVFSDNVVGYANHFFVIGNNLFCNPLDAAANNLSGVFNPATTPDGTVISLWNPATSSFYISATNSAGTWTQDLPLNPGTGAVLMAPEAFINTFVGRVLNHDGTPYHGVSPIPTPQPFAGPNGLYLLSDACPIADTGSDIFFNIIGRQPHAGEQVITAAGTSTYLGDSTWDVLPLLKVGDAAFLNIGPSATTTVLLDLAPVPEPSTLALGLLGLALIPACRRRRY